ncbi:MAG: RNA-binding protein [Bacteroidetes bacterium]|nr:RNA-binding protein [Bacteroidota bacterium]
MKLFIRNLEGSINEVQLESLFAQFGPVLSTKIIYDKITWESKGYAFLEMKNKADAEKAIAALNGKEVRGKELMVMEADEKKK